MTPDDRTGTYDLKSVTLPHLTGLPLRLFVGLLEGPLGRLLASTLFQSAGITWLRERQIDQPPTMRPLHVVWETLTEAVAVPRAQWPDSTPSAPPGFRFTTAFDYAQAFREGTTTPTNVAHRYLSAIGECDAGDLPLRAMVAVDHGEVLRQAAEATKRIQDGRPLSQLDGVPVAVKDELDMQPYPTTVGTAFLGAAAAREDATVVARMRAAGALLIGKANMHEIGIGVTGLNPIHGTPRNPYAPDHFTGGSSSGPAAAVAAGLCPIAIGADGGGSIRIPASFCGVVGLKPTFGRVSELGAAPLCWSVAHVGPLSATAADAALAYTVMAGPDPRDAASMQQPPPTLAGWDRPDLDGVTLGVYWPWFRHATQEVVARCEAMLRALEGQGATVQEITIPGLEAARVAHTVTIASEMAQALSHTYARHHAQHGLDVRLNLAMARRFTSCDYVQAQRVRTQLLQTFDGILTQVDAVVTPSTALVAPLIPRAALSAGESDLSMLVEIMRFATPANLTGLPAISFPAGYSGAGLPVGMQAIGGAWREPMLLRIARAAERVVERLEPVRHYHLLTETTS